MSRRNNVTPYTAAAGNAAVPDAEEVPEARARALARCQPMWTQYRDCGAGGEDGAVRAGAGATRSEQAACGAVNEGADAPGGPVGFGEVRPCLPAGVEDDDRGEVVRIVGARVRTKTGTRRGRRLGRPAPVDAITALPGSRVHGRVGTPRHGLA